MVASSRAAPRPGVDVSVVVPVYGGTAALPELCARVERSLAGAGLSFEVILVDDHGSKDAWPAIKVLAASSGFVSGIRLTRNFGQHAATICGIEAASGEWVVTMDDDLEHPPECIPSLVEAGRNSEATLVYGVFKVRSHRWYRNASSEMMRRTLKRAFPELNDDYTSLRAIHHTIAAELPRFGTSRPYIDGMLSWITSDVATVEVIHETRRHGRSGYTLRRLLSHALNVFVTFSQLPLRLVTLSGVAIALLSFLAMLVVVYGKLSGRIAVGGYASLMFVVLFACGIQLMFLGIIGEYVARLMAATYRRPPYVAGMRTRQHGDGGA